jgi:WD40 repeat protein
LVTLVVFLLSATGLWWFLPTRPRLTLAAGKQDVFAGFSPDSHWVATLTMPKKGNWDENFGVIGGPVRLWDVHTGQERLQLAADWQSIRLLPFSPDSKLVATVSEDGRCALWDTETGQVQFTMRTTPPGMGIDHPPDVRFGPDGLSLAVVSPNGEDLQLWDVPSGQIRTMMPGVRCFAYAPDGKAVAVAENATGTMRPWQSALLAFLATLGSPLPLPSQALHESHQVVKIRDLTTGQPLITLPGFVRFAASMAFSPDGRYLAVGTHSTGGQFGMECAEVRCWDITTGQEQTQFKITEVGFGPLSTVVDLHYSGDGQTLITKHAIGSILWDITGNPPKLLQRVQGSDCWVGPIAPFSFAGVTIAPDGRTLVFHRNPIQLWDVPPGPPWLQVVGLAAVPAALVFTVGLCWRKQRRIVA